jgi:uncharacterized protein YjbI with pentapeptide repeats
LARANLMGASLVASTVTGADLRGALLYDTNAAYASRQGVLLEGAQISRCKLGDARDEGSG